jgi:hypothetical protein
MEKIPLSLFYFFKKLHSDVYYPTFVLLYFEIEIHLNGLFQIQSFANPYKHFTPQGLKGLH